jgi:hypothetical protein
MPGIETVRNMYVSMYMETNAIIQDWRDGMLEIGLILFLWAWHGGK